MKSTHAHPPHPFKVHRATICSPTLLPDRQLRDAVHSRFGRQPILIASVPARFYQRFGESHHQHPMRLVTKGVERRDVLVLLLQFGGHQLRCVASLRRPPVQQLLATLKEHGSLPMVLFEDDGHRYAALECDVPCEDVEAIVALGLPAAADMADCRAELTYVALSCLLEDEIPSLVRGETLRHWDVVLVEDEKPLKTVPMR